MYNEAIKVLTKALEVFKIGDNSHILYALTRYTMMIGWIMDSLQFVNYLVERKWNEVEYQMIKSFILSLNNKTLTQSKEILLKCKKVMNIDYDDISLIREFK